MAELIVVLGGGGVAREVSWLLSEAQPSLTPDVFVVADRDWQAGDLIDGIRAIPDSEFNSITPRSIAAYLAVGLPAVRRALHERLRCRPGTAFPTLVHASASMDRRPGNTQIGGGVILYPLASLTTGVVLGDFVQVNPCATLGHGAHIGRYTTVCPGANISGNVEIGEGCFIGAGAVIREGVRVADNCVIGAGAVVLHDVGEAGTWAGVPAKKIGR